MNKWRSLRFWYCFGDDFLFNSIGSLNSDSLLLLYNLLSVLFDFNFRDVFCFSYHLFESTLFWLINLTKLIVWEFKKGNKSIGWRNCENLMVFPRKISKCSKVEVTHTVKGFHRLGVIKDDTVGSGNRKNHIIRLFEESFLRIGFFKKNRTEFTYQNRLFTGFDGKWGFSIVVLPE